MIIKASGYRTILVEPQKSGVIWFSISAGISGALTSGATFTRDDMVLLKVALEEVLRENPE